eukprot:6168497-Prymnesium_polylepis.1
MRIDGGSGPDDVSRSMPHVARVTGAVRAGGGVGEQMAEMALAGWVGGARSKAGHCAAAQRAHVQKS